MRIVEKILYGFAGLLALMLLFIAFCHYNPELAVKIGAVITANAEGNAKAGAADTGGGPLDAQTPVTVGELPAAEAVRKAADTGAEQDSGAEPKLNIPKKVAGLSGYIPVKSTGTEISQQKADEISKQLGKGETGSALTFDTAIYPYYGIINDTQKALYRQIYANADAQNKHFAPVGDITANDLKNAFTSVVNDHPGLFWVDTAYKYSYTPKGSVADITLVFNVTANSLDTAKSDFEAAAKRITDAAYGVYTDYEKEKIAHDELIGKVKYDANAPMNQSAYSALVYGRTVCAGYARALQYILQQMKVPCYYVTGYAGENHAWNIVKLDDGFYNVDSTWDDTDPNTYDYFNRSDTDYAPDHVRRDLSIYLPPCNGNKYSGLEVNPSVAPSQPSKPSQPAVSQPSTPSQPAVSQPSTPSQPASQQPSSSGNTGNAASNTDSITVMTVRGGGDQNYIDNVDSYFSECFASMIDNDDAVVTFDIIVKDKKLWDSIYKAYEKGDSQEGYIDRYLVEKHKNACSMRVEAVPRTDGSYLLRHRGVIS